MKRVIAFIGTVLLLAGCASSKSYLKSKDFSERAPAFKRVGVLIAEAKIYEISVDNTVRELPEKSSRCRQCLESSILRSIGSRGLSPILIPVDEDARSLLADFQPWHIVVTDAYRHGNLESASPLVKVQPFASTREVDAIAFVSLRDHVQTTGRKVFSYMMAVAMKTQLQTGVGGADIVLVDATGRAMYYDARVGPEYNFTDDSDIEKVSEQIVAGLTSRP